MGVPPNPGSGRLANFHHWVQTHNAVVVIPVLVTITLGLLVNAIALGAGSGDSITNGFKITIVFLGILAIPALWICYSLVYRGRLSKVPACLVLTILLIISPVLVWGVGLYSKNASAGGTSTAQPPSTKPPPPPTPPTEGWQWWHHLSLDQKVFDNQNRQLSVALRGPDEIDVFAIDDAGQVWDAWGKGENWRWDKLPTNVKFGHGARQVTAVSRKTKTDPVQDTLDVFAIGDNGQVWRTLLDGRHWGDWAPLPAASVTFDTTAQSVAAVSRAPGKLDLFVMGTDGQVWGNYWEEGENSDSWATWFPIPGGEGFFAPDQHVGAVARSPNNLDLFVVRGGELWSTYWYLAANVWAGWQPQRAVAPWEPSGHGPHVQDNQRVAAISKSIAQYGQNNAGSGDQHAQITSGFDVFAIDTDGWVWSNFWAEGYNDNWSGWFKLGNLPLDKAQQVAAVARSLQNVDVFGLGADKRLLMTYWTGGTVWHPWAPPNNVGTEQFSPLQTIAAVSASPSALDLFAIGNDGLLWTAFWQAPKR
ncbi:hypothetical protein [Mycolicibacterium moriokaense]|uniref:Uncharacterized protein n=1 Tax=Mycolicibacterium moriokaense TaxID=39691 RepID=A0A318HE60_9MYCO|nr:hypothetical protein [Mycolicibacterium moriokaense]PXW99589.1 hypothetical protein C8E89_14012 [Mycolicibacterium moriokaense]